MSEQSRPPIDLEAYFHNFRIHTIGINNRLTTPYGELPKVYMDWTASGLAYGHIERRILRKFLPRMANTHTDQTSDGEFMTKAYNKAKEKIKKSVGADPKKDILAVEGSGVTGAINKLQRIFGFKLEDQAKHFAAMTGSDIPFDWIAEEDKPLVVISSLEHHSNDTSWLETIAKVEKLPLTSDGNVDPEHLDDILRQNARRKMKFGSFTAASNVTGIRTPVHDLARVMHDHEGYIFVDYAAAAPYDEINMHPDDPEESLDAVFISPHKMLGGQQTPGLLVFNSQLYPLGVTPDRPGGGTVQYTTPWGVVKYHNDISIAEIEEREDGGTPPFIQTIRASLAFDLKDRMGVENIHAREQLLTDRLIDGLSDIPGIVVFQPDNRNRLGIVSHYYGDQAGAEFVPFDLATRLLNDKFGIEGRGGCSCAGTLGHCLLHIDKQRSRAITDKADTGDRSDIPGWVRLSVHPITEMEEVDFAIEASKQIAENGQGWGNDYVSIPRSNKYMHKSTDPEVLEAEVDKLLTL
jgi:selenocysteine lyase/cysteine desulfurase